MDDELLREFINESREHLATIEVDLLAIEEGGADIDEELVNKVFRAAHSIKGGSGFFGLTKVKELAHRSETVLDMLRSRKMAPNAEIINVLLAAFDRLREMINDSANSESMEIDDLVVGLTGLASSFLPGEQKASLTRDVVLQSASGWTVAVPEVDVERARRSGRFIYGIEYDLIHDVDRQGKNVLQVFRDFETTGEILECALGFDEAGTLDGPLGNTLPLRLVHATVIDPEMAGALFEVGSHKLSVLYNPRTAAHPPAVVPPATATPAARVETAPAEVVPSRAFAAAPATVAPPPTPPVPSAPRASAAKADAASEGPRASDETLRVSVSLLETLMNLAGELVLSRNQLRTAIATRNVQSLTVADQRLSHVTSEMQDVIMQTRLQPIGNVFGKFPRVVRDMSAALKKDIFLDIRGRDVALDRSLIEGLSDPLTHMVRNSVDHGIELPEQRVASGKSGQGTLRIEARHEAGQVVVEIADDGKGIDPKKIADSAVRKGLIAAEKVAAMSDEDRVALIFLPGLSTAENVTDISGRGVGMDVVKTNLDRLGGKVEIKSTVGVGTTFRIKLPLTLAIIPSLIVSVEQERFAIPQVNVEELLRVRAEDVKKRIEVVGDAEVLLLRDRIIPLVRFDRVLGCTSTFVDPKSLAREVDRRVAIADRRSPRHPAHGPTAAQVQAGPAPCEHARAGADRRTSAASALEIAVVTTGTMTYGLVVDAFHDTEEIVVKPLGRHLKHLREYAGATILGDGQVALILDVAGTAVRADLASVSGSARAARQAEAVDKERLEETHSLLLFHAGQNQICAVPLDVVERIERISASQIDLAGNRRTMQYRGASLPLVALSDAASVPPVDGSKDLAVIVSRVHGHEVGLLAAMPVDVVDTKTAIDHLTHRQTGIAGSAIIRDRTTLIADTRELVSAVHPEWMHERASERTAALPAPAVEPDATAGVGVLLAEDSDFFRAQVKRFLEEEGYTVFAAPDGEAAWALLLAHLGDVKLVVTDLEMPRLTGFGLAQRIRADERTATLPIIAVTSLAGEDDVAKGKAAGIDEYQVKLDRDRLIEGVRGFARAR
jgi:two-component system chemotaxis sensor kinase CheA